MFKFSFMRHRFGFSFWGSLVRRIGGVALACSLSFAPQAGRASEPPSSQPQDSRLARLRTYFRSQRSPLEKWSGSFVQAADKNNLDWRLLPSIAMIESGGGKHYRRNNVFGWRSGRARFQSIDQAIHYVASRLSQSPIYKGKPLPDMLRKYNPAKPIYARKIMAVMDSISPSVLTVAALPAR